MWFLCLSWIQPMIFLAGSHYLGNKTLVCCCSYHNSTCSSFFFIVEIFIRFCQASAHKTTAWVFITCLNALVNNCISHMSAITLLLLVQVKWILCWASNYKLSSGTKCRLLLSVIGVCLKFILMCCSKSHILGETGASCHMQSK